MPGVRQGGPLVAGRLDQLVRFQQETTTSDGGGGVTRSWGDIALRAEEWAKVLPVRGDEQVAAQSQRGVVLYQVIVRYRDDITSAMRIQWGTKTLNVRSAVDPDNERRWLQILAEEGLAT